MVATSAGCNGASVDLQGRRTGPPLKHAVRDRPSGRGGANAPPSGAFKPRTAAAAALGVLALAVLMPAIWIALPLPDDLDSLGPPGVSLEDRHGLPLRATRAADGARLRPVSIEEMDADLLVAFVAFEDRRFQEHGGIDWQSVVRAARDNLRAARVVSGASTITMQTARLVRPFPRTWLGKARQALWALRLERHLSKQEILERYLNRVPLGQGTVGVSAAAALYFDASPGQLSLGQAALLAGLAHAPSDHNPLVSLGKARERRDLVLARLLELGHVTEQDARLAAREPVLARTRDAPFLAPHFTTALLLASAARATVAASGEPGVSCSPPRTPCPNVIRTSLDLGLQHAVEAEVRHAVAVLDDRDAQHAAAVVLDNVNGEILAWVGSPDFWADTAGQVDMVTSRRQPGSALKPFLYGLAIDRGRHAASILADMPRTFETPAGPYRPRNYDRRFRGPVRLREALASSLNVPAVELAAELGPPALLATLRRAGFASLRRDAEYYGVGLALGNGDVTLLELANAYRALANLGAWTPVRWTPSAPPTALRPSHHTAAATHLEPTPPTRVVSAAAAAVVLDILSDPVARVPGFGLDTPFDFPFPVAVKTGTSRRFTDNWAVGVTGRFAVAVWVGNFSGRPMRSVSGVTGAGPLLHRTVLAVARRLDPGTLPSPASLGLGLHEVCLVSGQAPTPFCPTTTEWFPPGHAPRAPCRWHQPEGRLVLPPQYAEWTHLAVVEPARAVLPARLVSTAAAPEPSFRIVAPQDGDQYRVPPGVEPRYATLSFRAEGLGERETVRWLVDGDPLSEPRWRLRPGRHVVRAESTSGAVDEVVIVVAAP